MGKLGVSLYSPGPWTALQIQLSNLIQEPFRENIPTTATQESHSLFRCYQATTVTVR